jgi:hypothetical protein
MRPCLNFVGTPLIVQTDRGLNSPLDCPPAQLPARPLARPPLRPRAQASKGAPPTHRAPRKPRSHPQPHTLTLPTTHPQPYPIAHRLPTCAPRGCSSRHLEGINTSGLKHLHLSGFQMGCFRGCVSKVSFTGLLRRGFQGAFERCLKPLGGPPQRFCVLCRASTFVNASASHRNIAQRASAARVLARNRCRR